MPPTAYSAIYQRTVSIFHDGKIRSRASEIARADGTRRAFRRCGSPVLAKALHLLIKSNIMLKSTGMFALEKPTLPTLQTGG